MYSIPFSYRKCRVPSTHFEGLKFHLNMEPSDFVKMAETIAGMAPAKLKWVSFIKSDMYLMEVVIF